jgi:hypothetical protein
MAKTSTKSKRQSANPPLDPSKTRPLALTIPKNGFTYEQVLRDGDYAIYKQRLNAEGDKPVRGCLAFEV